MMVENWHNLGFVAKLLTKFVLFDKRKEKRMSKAFELFWQDLAA